MAPETSRRNEARPARAQQVSELTPELLDGQESAASDDANDSQYTLAMPTFAYDLEDSNAADALDSQRADATNEVKIESKGDSITQTGDSQPQAIARDDNARVSEPTREREPSAPRSADDDQTTNAEVDADANDTAREDSGEREEHNDEEDDEFVPPQQIINPRRTIAEKIRNFFAKLFD